MEASALQAPARFGRLTASPALLRMRSDEQLVSLLRAGRQEAFGAIHERYRQRLFAYVRQMLGSASRQDAEDVLQDVFARAYTALRGDSREINLRPWLYRVAHNRCIDHLRRPTPVLAELTESTETATKPLHDPFEDVQRREDLKRLVADIGRLPSQQKSALLLREINGLSYNELAEALDVTVPAVKSLLVRARVELVETAEARGVACASIREELLLTCDTGGRIVPRTRRHLRDCAGCTEYRESLRSMRKSFAALSPVAAFGPLTLLAKLGGFGGSSTGAGGGAAGAAGTSTAAVGVAGTASSTGATAMTGAAGAGLGAVTAGKIAAVVSAAAITAGGAVVIERTVTNRPAPVAAATATPAGGEAQPAAPGIAPAQPFGTPAATGGARVPAARPGAAGPALASPAGSADPTVASVDPGGAESRGGVVPALPTGPVLGSPVAPVLGTPLDPVIGTPPERLPGSSAPGDRSESPSGGAGPVGDNGSRPLRGPDAVRAPQQPAVESPRGGPVAEAPAVRPERPADRPDKPAKAPKPERGPGRDSRPPVAVTPPSAAPGAGRPTVPELQSPSRRPDKPANPIKAPVDGVVAPPRTPPGLVGKAKPDKTPPGLVGKAKPNETPPGLVGKAKPDKTPPGLVGKAKPDKTPPGLVGKGKPSPSPVLTPTVPDPSRGASSPSLLP